MRILNAVDGVVIFGEPRTTGLIRQIQPHIFAKGGDYTVETLNPEERSALEACGAVIHILPELKGRSTTATIQRMRTPESGPGTPPGSGKVRIAVLGSGAGTNFDAISAALDAGTLDAQVVLVASDVATAPILEKARRRGIRARTPDASIPQHRRNWQTDSARRMWSWWCSPGSCACSRTRCSADGAPAS